jgi:hypothetical protein
VTFVSPSRYTPVLSGRRIGISFLKDSQPNEPDTYLGQKEAPTPMEVEKPLEKVPEEPKQSEDDLAPPEEF